MDHMGCAPWAMAESLTTPHERARTTQQAIVRAVEEDVGRRDDTDVGGDDQRRRGEHDGSAEKDDVDRDALHPDTNIRLRAHANRKQRLWPAREQDNRSEGQPHAVRYPAYPLEEEAKRKKKDTGERGSRLVADAVGDLANHLTVCPSMLCHSVRTKHGQKQRAHVHAWVGAASGRVRSAGTLIFSSRA